jgi:hypothetical protein
MGLAAFRRHGPYFSGRRQSRLRAAWLAIMSNNEI